MKKRYILGALFLGGIILGGGFYRAHSFLLEIQKAGMCANADILLDRKGVFDLYQKQQAHQELTLEEQVFLKKIGLKYRKELSATTLEELYQDVIPLPLPLYQAQAFLMTHGGWMGQKAPFGTYHWDKGTYKKQHFNDKCAAALAFAYDIQTLPEFKMMRRLFVRLLEEDHPIKTSALLMLLSADTPQKEAYKKRLISAVERFEE